MNEFFAHGFEKTAKKGRQLATILGGIPLVNTLGIAPGIAAKEGRGLRTGLGALAGNVAGGTAGALLGGLTSSYLNGTASVNPLVAIGAGTLGSMGGGALGAHLAHGPDNEKKASMNKEAISLPRIPEKLKEAVKYLTSGRSLRNMVARHKISKLPLVGGSEILKGIGGGLAQNKVKNMDLRAIGKNLKRAGTEMTMLAKNKPGRLAGELAIGGGLLYAAKKMKNAKGDAKAKRQYQEYSQSM